MVKHPEMVYWKATLVLGNCGLFIPYIHPDPALLQTSLHHMLCSFADLVRELPLEETHHSFAGVGSATFPVIALGMRGVEP